MRLIPGNTKVQIEIFNGFTLWDMLVAAIELTILALLVVSNIPFKWVLVALHVIISVVLLTKIDKESNYLYYIHILSYLGYKKKYDKFYTDEKLTETADKGEREVTLEDLFPEEDENPSETNKPQKESKKQESKSAEADDIQDISSFTGISDGFIEFENKYYGVAFEIPDVEFRFFSEIRRAHSIENGVGAVLRSLRNDYCSNLLKLERPVDYRSYELDVYRRIEDIKAGYEKGIFNDDEVKSRLAILYARLEQIKELRNNNRVVIPYYYLIIFESDKDRLNIRSQQVLSTLAAGEINAKRLNDKQLALMLKYSNSLDFDEKIIEKIRPEDYAKWAMPGSVSFTPRRAVIDGMVTYTLRAVKYPSIVDDAWLASLATFPSTKVMIKFKTMDSSSAIKSIDKSLSELRALIATAKTDSQVIEAQAHMETLQSMLVTLKSNNEILLCTNIYVTCYDLSMTRQTQNDLGSFRYNLNGMKRVLRRNWSENGFGLNNLEFQQVEGFIASQVSGFDPFENKGRGIPSNTLAASYPWVFPHIGDEQGFYVGGADGVPIFMNFFARSSDRVNSNMVVIGKSGSGKSYAVKTMLANLAADNAKIFVIDPENEYTELAHNLHGKFINVASNENGIINPFHIIADLDDENGAGSKSAYSSHLMFLEEFFRMILPDCDKDSLEYLNTLTERVYRRKGIGPGTDVSKLPPQAYPTFDDLYDEVLIEFQRTNIDYVKTMLRTLMNYVSKFSTGGRNSQIWNGYSSICTDDNFTVFNFQGLLANQNSLVSNAQMLLVLKYINNEIIKNRVLNDKYGLDKKIVIVIDEAHVFIDEKFPVALDFMFQMAKRIRKYNGMQIVITQNVKDFVGSEEIARKSTAIINACQYSFIFALSPNDMDDLCRLYDKAGKINEYEQEQIVQAPRGQAFVILSPTSRTSFSFRVPEETRKMFKDNYRNPYFDGLGGDKNWLKEMGASVEKHNEALVLQNESTESIEYIPTEIYSNNTSYLELSESEYIEKLPEAPDNTAPDEAAAVPDVPEASVTVQKADLPPIEDVSRFDERTNMLLEGVIGKLGQISDVISANAGGAELSYSMARINELAEQVKVLSERINSDKRADNSAGEAGSGLNNAAGEGEAFYSIFDSVESKKTEAESEEADHTQLGNINDYAGNAAEENPFPSFDIFELLNKESEELKDSNKIYDFVGGLLDVPHIEITLTDLINYNKSTAGGKQ